MPMPGVALELEPGDVAVLSSAVIHTNPNPNPNPNSNPGPDPNPNPNPPNPNPSPNPSPKQVFHTSRPNTSAAPRRIHLAQYSLGPLRWGAAALARARLAQAG